MTALHLVFISALSFSTDDSFECPKRRRRTPTRHSTGGCDGRKGMSEENEKGRRMEAEKRGGIVKKRHDEDGQAGRKNTEGGRKWPEGRPWCFLQSKADQFVSLSLVHLSVRPTFPPILSFLTNNSCLYNPYTCLPSRD